METTTIPLKKRVCHPKQKNNQTHPTCLLLYHNCTGHRPSAFRQEADEKCSLCQKRFLGLILRTVRIVSFFRLVHLLYWQSCTILSYPTGIICWCSWQFVKLYQFPYSTQFWRRQMHHYKKEREGESNVS